MAKTRNRYYNPNPRKIDTSDCVVRALCKAVDEDWDEVFAELCEIGFELKVMPSDDEAWKAFLIRHGFTYQKLKVKRGTKRPRVNEFAGKNRKGTFVLRVANHVVTCEDGYYYDIWDCGDCSMYGYWVK